MVQVFLRVTTKSTSANDSGCPSMEIMVTLTTLWPSDSEGDIASMMVSFNISSSEIFSSSVVGVEKLPRVILARTVIVVDVDIGGVVVKLALG